MPQSHRHMESELIELRDAVQSSQPACARPQKSHRGGDGYAHSQRVSQECRSRTRDNRGHCGHRADCPASVGMRRGRGSPVPGPESGQSSKDQARLTRRTAGKDTPDERLAIVDRCCREPGSQPLGQALGERGGAHNAGIKNGRKTQESGHFPADAESVGYLPENRLGKGIHLAHRLGASLGRRRSPENYGIDPHAIRLTLGSELKLNAIRRTSQTPPGGYRALDMKERSQPEFQAGFSCAWGIALFNDRWSECADLNRGPLAPHASALSRLSYTPQAEYSRAPQSMQGLSGRARRSRWPPARAPASGP